MKVQNFYNKNQFIIFGGDAIVTFQSYNSIIAKIDKNGTLFLGNDWNYSKTTMKHLVSFLRQNGLGVLGCAKDIYEAIDRGHARNDEAIAVWVDTTM